MLKIEEPNNLHKICLLIQDFFVQASNIIFVPESC